jgi:hypothetical protein
MFPILGSADVYRCKGPNSAEFNVNINGARAVNYHAEIPVVIVVT